MDDESGDRGGDHWEPWGKTLEAFIGPRHSEEQLRKEREESKKAAEKRMIILKQNAARKDKQKRTDKDGNDRPREWTPDAPLGWEKDRWEHYLLNESARHCEVTDVVFCDEHENRKDTFHPHDNIHVLVTFTNVTKVPACIYCGKDTFQRDGICLELDGVNQKYIGGPPMRIPVVNLQPGESYTFFKLMSKSWKNRINSWGTGTLIITPAKEGTYTIRVKADPLYDCISKKKWQFTISK